MSVEITQVQEAESFATHEAIAATLQRYIDAAVAGSGAQMQLVFADGARVCGAYSGKPVAWTREEFCALIDKSGPVTGLEAHVVGIEYQGNAAMARLEARNWRGTRYTDFFVLLRQDGGWQINSKVFFAHSRG